jgi:hypothetical protein
MIDYAPTQARSKGVISTPSCGWGQVEVVVAKAPSASPLPTTDRVDKLYRQLAEIHATTTMQLVECACWCHSDSTPSPVQARIGQLGPNKTPSMTRAASPSPSDCSPQASLRRPGQHIEPSVRW